MQTEIKKIQLTDEEIFKASKNFLLSIGNDYCQVLKMTKWEYQNSIGCQWGQFISANIRIITKFGQKKTAKVIIHPEHENWDVPNSMVTSSNDFPYEYRKYSDMIILDLENKEFEDDFETAIAKRDAHNAEVKRNEEIRKLQRDLNWNIKQQRSFKASKRTYTKYDISFLNEVLPELTIPQQEYLTGVLEALDAPEQPKTTKEYISMLVGAKKELFIEIEKSFEEKEEEVFKNVLEWFKNQKEYSHYSEEKLQREAKFYVEGQKMKLFFSVGKHLNNLEIKTVENNKFRNTRNGFEGSWKITLDDGATKVFETHSIIASGYIQRMHYRYLSKLY